MPLPLYINSFSVVSPLGYDAKDILKGLVTKDPSGMLLRDDLVVGTPLRIGTINERLLPEMPEGFLDLACNCILLFCMKRMENEINEAINRYGKNRIAVIIGSSNVGIPEGQKAIDEKLAAGTFPEWFDYDILRPGSPSKFVAEYLGITGINYVISTACSSSAKAFSSARNLIAAGICDAAIVGGVDALCSYVINGFHSLEALAGGLSNPFSRNRDGINIGEAGAMFIVSKEDTGGNMFIAGIGETSDAYHITSPQPDGEPARAAMAMAMQEAGISAGDIGYVSLHGTGTVLNDSMESAAVYSIFGDDVPCGSVKPLIGHTLGACGAVELAFCHIVMDGKLNPSGKLPPHPWDGERDEKIAPIKLSANDSAGDLRYIISNSFAFGGSNASIVIGKK